MADIRHLPDVGARVETGPVQFGDDWPGVFIRGDNAFGYCMALDSLLANPTDPFAAITVLCLREALSGADLTGLSKTGQPAVLTELVPELADLRRTMERMPRSKDKTQLLANLQRVERAAARALLAPVPTPPPAAAAAARDSAAVLLAWLDANPRIHVDHRHGRFQLRDGNTELSGWKTSFQEALAEARRTWEAKEPASLKPANGDLQDG